MAPLGEMRPKRKILTRYLTRRTSENNSKNIVSGKIQPVFHFPLKNNRTNQQMILMGPALLFGCFRSPSLERR